MMRLAYLPLAFALAACGSLENDESHPPKPQQETADCHCEDGDPCICDGEACLCDGCDHCQGKPDHDAGQSNDREGCEGGACPPPDMSA